MCPGVSLGVLGYPGVSWGNQTDPLKREINLISRNQLFSRNQPIKTNIWSAGIISFFQNESI